MLEAVSTRKPRDVMPAQIIDIHDHEVCLTIRTYHDICDTPTL